MSDVQIVEVGVPGPIETVVVSVGLEAEAAAASAAAAASSASTATTQANNAGASATNAANSATSASSYAAIATTQASNAGTSAAQAATSAAGANTSATNASSSASSAVTSATNAASSATSASSSASTAATHANSAATSATNASTSATQAATSATSAFNSASSASASAGTATTQANNAIASAASAASSATSAANSAAAAETYKSDTQDLFDSITATDTQVLFRDGTGIGGSSNLIFAKTSGRLTVNGTLNAGGAALTAAGVHASSGDKVGFSGSADATGVHDAYFTRVGANHIGTPGQMTLTGSLTVNGTTGNLFAGTTFLANTYANAQNTYSLGAPTAQWLEVVSAGYLSYNSYANASNWERFSHFWSGNTLCLATQKAGTGALRPIHIAGSEVDLYAGGTSANGWKVDTAGHWVPKDTNKDLGDPMNRVRTGYFATVDASTGVVAPLGTFGTVRIDGSHLELGNASSSWITSVTQPVVYGTGGGGVAPFDVAGHLVLSPRISGAARNIIMSVQAGVQNAVLSAGGFDLIGNLSVKAAAGVTGITVTPPDTGAYSALTLQGSGGSNTAGGTLTGGDGGLYLDANEFRWRNTALASRMTLASSGNLLVGTTNDTEWDGVNGIAIGGVNPAIKFHPDAGGSVFLNYVSSAGNRVVWYNSTSNAAVMSLSSRGVGMFGALAPFAWETTYRAVDLESYGGIYSDISSGFSGFVTNAYVGSASWRTKWGGKAALYQQSAQDGYHRFFSSNGGPVADTAFVWETDATLKPRHLMIGANTPTNFHSSMHVVELGNSGDAIFSDGSTYVSNNSYYDGVSWKHARTGGVAMYAGSGGVHYWYAGPSQVAGSAWAPAIRMFLDSNADLTVIGRYISPVGAGGFVAYNNYTDAANYELGEAGWNSNILTIGTRSAGTGLTRGVRFMVGGASRWEIDVAGHFLAVTDGVYNIGALGGGRPLHIFAKDTIQGAILRASGPTSQLVVQRRDTSVDKWSIYSASGSLQFYDALNGDVAAVSPTGTLWTKEGLDIGDTGTSHFQRLISNVASTAGVNFVNGATTQFQVHSRGDISMVQLASTTWDMLYDVPTAKTHQFRINASTMLTVNATGLVCAAGVAAAGEVNGAVLRTSTAYTVGTLPSAAGQGQGARAWVTDSNVAAAGNFGNVVATGGANKVPVYSDGTNWRIG